MGTPYQWWVSDAPPWEKWPGVSIKLEAIEHDDGQILSPCGEYYWDEQAANRFSDWCRKLIFHYKGEHAGLPFELLDWQEDLIFRPLFGWKRVKDGTRRFRTVFLFIPKKNGKSWMASALGLYLLAFDGEAGAEVYSAAADRDQARIVFGDATAVVDNSPHLKRALSTYKTAITYEKSNSVYRVLSSNVGTKHGFNISALLFDEIHTQKTRELYDTLQKGIASRTQPVVFITTTAGTERESICGEQYDYSKSIISGDFDDDTFLPVVFEAPKDLPWDSPETWRMCNPSLGVTINEDYFVTEVQQAKNDLRKLNAFKRLHLNIWTDTQTAWIDLDDWKACEAEMDLEELQGIPCVAGVDLSQKLDLTALALVFRRPEETAIHVNAKFKDEEGTETEETLSINYSIDILTWVWVPEDTIKVRSREDKVPYDVWNEQGWLTATPGYMVDYDYIKHTIETEVVPKYQPSCIGFDPYCATEIMPYLDKKGIPVVEVRQGPKTLSEPTKLLEALIKAGRVRHNGSPLMNWCVSNVVIQSDQNENVRPVKKHQKKRIDPVVAIINALALLSQAGDSNKSIYETRDLLVF